MDRLLRFHRDLLKAYGPQGWWPLLGHEGTNPTKSGSITGYHPGDYGFPRTEAERFEIAVGAILTQNTAWPNVEKALKSLAESAALAPEPLLALPMAELATLIRASGFHNAKALKLKALSAFWLRLQDLTPTREALLAVHGVGPETADSIRLYAFAQPEMVVDAYTRRVFARLGWVPEDIRYEPLKAFCVTGLPRDTELYQEFHALVVEHAKRAKAVRAEDWSRPLPRH